MECASRQSNGHKGFTIHGVQTSVLNVVGTMGMSIGEKLGVGNGIGDDVDTGMEWN